jgi:LysM repeat protein
MKSRSSATARIFAATALAVAFVLAIVVIGGGVGGDSSRSKEGGHPGKTAHKEAEKKRHVPASYEVQSGDTLVSIAHKTGVPVVRIEALNPEVDPQILIVGETLKLR